VRHALVAPIQIAQVMRQLRYWMPLAKRLQMHMAILNKECILDFNFILTFF